MKCFAIWHHFMNHNASVFCSFVQIRAFIVLNLTGIFICKYEMKNEIESGISNSKTTLLCKWPILWEIVRHLKKVWDYHNGDHWQLIDWLIDWLIDLQSLQSFVNKHLSKLSLEVDNIDSQVLMNYRAVIKGHEMGILPTQWISTTMNMTSGYFCRKIVPIKNLSCLFLAMCLVYPATWNLRDVPGTRQDTAYNITIFKYLLNHPYIVF